MALKKQKTLYAAKEQLKKNLDEGTTCPCCGQFAKRYRRKINSGMARLLIWLHVCSQEEEWVSVKRFEHISREVSKLAWWGFVEAQANTDPAKRDSGNWRLTSSGRAFVCEETRALSHAVVALGDVERLEGDEIAIQDALGDAFNYSQLMGR